MFRLRHRAVQGYLLRRGECRGAARSGGGRHTRTRICGLQALYDARGHRGRRATGLHGHRRRRRPDHAAGRRRGMRLHLLGERHHALRHRKGVAGGQDRLPQTDLMPPLSDPRRAVSNGTAGLNYHRWSVCAPARECGRRLGIPVYKALREPIVRRFGEEFYKALEAAEEFIRQQ